jgi:phage gpG-like protein
VPGVSDVLDLAPLLAPLRRLGWDGRALGPLLNVLRRAALADVRRSFAEGADVDGRQMAPKKGGGKLLVRSGRLRAGTRARARGTAVEVMNNVAYAGYLQWGNHRMPARRFLGFGARVRPEVERVLADFVRSVTPE